MEFKDKPTQDAISQNRSQWRGCPTGPLNYKVIIEIGENTSMGFVEQAIIRVFNLERQQLAKLREQFIKNNRAECGTFSREIAETKASEFNGLANDNEHQLECFIEVSE